MNKINDPLLVESRNKMNFKVLVVDDDNFIQQLLKRIINETTDFEVDLAGNGELAYDLYKQHLHKLIILDIRLGGKMSGIDLLKKIKGVDQMTNVIMITGYGTIDLAVECMKSGAWDFITKPFSYDHFELIIKRAAENILLKNLAQERDYFFELSRLDSLTEVYNRRLFDHIISAELSRATRYKRSLSLLLIDIDNFKSINDDMGHQKGDEVLKTMAMEMKEVIRESDLLFRYGGDEFAILLPETSEEGAHILAERLREKINMLEIKSTEHSRVLSVSIGGAIFPKNGSSKANLIKSADLALLKAKKSSKNQVVFSS